MYLYRNNERKMMQKLSSDLLLTGWACSTASIFLIVDWGQGRFHVLWVFLNVPRVIHQFRSRSVVTAKVFDLRRTLANMLQIQDCEMDASHKPPFVSQKLFLHRGVSSIFKNSDNSGAWRLVEWSVNCGRSDFERSGGRANKRLEGCGYGRGQVLTSCGADVEHANDKGWSPTFVAAYFGHGDVRGAQRLTTTGLCKINWTSNLEPRNPPKILKNRWHRNYRSESRDCIFSW